MRLSECGIRFIAEFEAFYPFVYDDAVYPTREWNGGAVEGTLTIGFGTTDPTIVDAYIHRRCTRAQAESWFLDSVASRYEPPLVARHWPLNQAQHDALLSFTYNSGTGWVSSNPKGYETIRRTMDEGRYADVPTALLLYRNPGTVFEAGLRRRREREGDLFSTGWYGFECDPTPTPKRRRRREDGDEN